MFATKSTHSNVHRGFVCGIALTVAMVLPLTALSGVASAASVGSAKWCANHPKLAKTTAACVSTSAGGGATGGTGGAPPNLIVSVSPNPVPEVGTSEADFLVQVEALPIFANQTVTISSQQLELACGSVTWISSASGSISAVIGTGIAPLAPVTLDNDGNATVEVQGENCAPGTDQIEVDLTKAPYTTVTTQLTLNPPAESWTPATGPTIGASPNPEVETGDGGPGNAASQVYVTFLIEENPIYAEQQVLVESPQLVARCLPGSKWSAAVGDTYLGDTLEPNGVSAELDNDGNAVVTFEGISCAPGASLVTADLVGGTGDTFSTTYTINPPASEMPTAPVL
jgi:hypothetical protein